MSILQILHGSVLYRRLQTEDLSAVSLVVDAFVSDGLWHTVKLTADDIHAVSWNCSFLHRWGDDPLPLFTHL